MSKEIIRNEYERSIDRVRGTRDRAYQIVRISGIMFTIFATVMIFIRSRGGEIHAIPKITFTVGFVILTVFGIILPVLFAYVFWKQPLALQPWALWKSQPGLPRQKVIKLRGITDDFLYELMIGNIRKNRETVKVIERRMKWIIIPGMLVGITAVLVSVVVLCL